MAELPLSRGKVAVVDDADFEAASKYKWSLVTTTTKVCYALARIGGKHVGLHRFLLAPPDDKWIDHINGNGLDNRRANLRLSTISQNSANCNRHKDNKTGFKGICMRGNGKPFAKICKDGKQYYLGTFNTKEEAARAYDAKARELYGEFSKTNF